MRKILFAALAVVSLAALSTTSAEAWGGCGPNRHPTPWGCRWNGPHWGPGWGPGWRYRHWHYWHHWHRYW